MTPEEAHQREEIATRLERRSDLYRNAGDEGRAGEADLLARAVRAAATLDEARALEAGSDPTASPPGFWRRLWDRLRSGRRTDDS